MAETTKMIFTGHCNICNSDIYFEGETFEEKRFIYELVTKMENFIKDTNKCTCSIIKKAIKEANENG